MLLEERDHCGDATGMVSANVLVASTRRRGEDGALAVGQGVAENQGGGHSKGWSPFLLSGGGAILNIELQTSFACVTLEGRRKYFAGGPRR